MNCLVRRLKATLTSLAIALLPAAGVLAAPAISLSGPATVQLGSNFSVNVLASGFTDLYAYQLDISFNPAVFQATGGSEGSFLKSAGTTFFDAGSVDNALGLTSFLFDSLLGPGPGASGSGVLATLTFHTVGAFQDGGTFALRNVIALDSSLKDVGVDVNSLSVTAVPEPATAGMMLVGLAAMAAFAGRRRRVVAKGSLVLPR